LALLGATFVGAPIAALLTGSVRPALLRRVGFAFQATGYGLAAVAVAADLPVAVAVGTTAVALGAVSTLRPTNAVLLPSVVRATSELTLGSLWLSYCEVGSALIGPLAAAALLSAGGPAAVLVGCAASAGAALVVFALRAERGPPAASDVDGWQPRRALQGAVGLVRRRPWTLGLLGVALARYFVLGALDVLLVVLAYESLGLDRSGAGWLNALVGAGAVLSAVVATLIVGRARLAPWLAISLLVSAVLCVVLGVRTSLPVAALVLPVLGLGASLVDALGRMLLQRAADPRLLGSLFALVELVAGIGLLLGSGVTQVLIAVGGVDVALYGMAVALAVVFVATGAAVWRADAHADLPVVEMSLLRNLPMFAPTSSLALEAIARSSVHLVVPDGSVLMHQGESGDRFYAVASGRFDVVQSGHFVRTAERGSFFGEVALLADVPRTATVTARGPGELLAIDRVPFLIAVTGSDTSFAAAWGVVRALDLDVDLGDEVERVPSV
jgi:hypothetical protein